MVSAWKRIISNTDGLTMFSCFHEVCISIVCTQQKSGVVSSPWRHQACEGRIPECSLPTTWCAFSPSSAPSTARENLNWSKALVVVHSMKMLLYMPLSFGWAWDWAKGKQKCMMQFTNHGWPNAQWAQIFQNGFNPGHIEEKNNNKRMLWQNICSCKCTFCFDEEALQKAWRGWINTSSQHQEQFYPLSKPVLSWSGSHRIVPIDPILII